MPQVQIGGERYNLFMECPNAKTCTIILRGGAEQFIDETERSLHDSIMVVRRALKNDTVVAGGGAIEVRCHGDAHSSACGNGASWPSVLEYRDNVLVSFSIANEQV